MYTDINEEIADARAEEEVRQAQAQRVAINRQATQTQGAKVSIDLEEYVALRQMQGDFERLMHSLFLNIEYRHSYCRIKDEFLDSVSAFYPDAIEQRIKELKALEEGE